MELEADVWTRGWVYWIFVPTWIFQQILCGRNVSLNHFEDNKRKWKNEKKKNQDIHILSHTERGNFVRYFYFIKKLLNIGELSQLFFLCILTKLLITRFFRGTGYMTRYTCAWKL